MLRDSWTKQSTDAKDYWISRVRHAEQLQEEDFHKETARDEVIQRELFISFAVACRSYGTDFTGK
jgi:hypothetical protein